MKDREKTSSLVLKINIIFLSTCISMPFISKRFQGKTLKSIYKDLDELAKRNRVILKNMPYQGNMDISTDENIPTATPLNKVSNNMLSINGSKMLVDLHPDEEYYRVLIICAHAPTTKHAGGLRILDIIENIKKKNAKTYIEIFTTLDKNLYGSPEELFLLVDKVIYNDDRNLSLTAYQEATGKLQYFDVVDFQFLQPVSVVEEYKSITKKIIFTPMESAIRVEAIDRNKDFLDKEDLETKDAITEAELCNIVDEIICVSKTDAECIKSSLNISNVIAIETGVSEIEFKTTKVENADSNIVTYVAYFGSQTNRDALAWYIKNVHPIILKEYGEYEFRIVGRGDVSSVLSGKLPCITHVGEVDRISTELEKSAIGIAPALWGAGFRGKINQYAIMNVPTVANKLAADGLAYKHGESIYITDDSKEFAHYIIELLKNKELRKQIVKAAQQVCKDNYSWDSKWNELKEVYSIPALPIDKTNPTIHAIVPSYKHGTFIEQRIRSIINQEYSNIRLTVIDDYSPDNSHNIISKLQKELNFSYIRREKNSGTPFSAWEYAANNSPEDFIWICESDDYCAKTMVPELVKLIQTRDDISLAYCGSHIINAKDDIIDSSSTYFKTMFHPTRWKKSFVVNGLFELGEFQSQGMVVPNMSSLLISSDVFKKAYISDLSKYRLAGDWLFVGRAMQYGSIAFLAKNLNYFRTHPQTARAQTAKEITLFEHIVIRMMLSEMANLDDKKILYNLRYDIVELYHEPQLLPLIEERMKMNAPHLYSKFITLYNQAINEIGIENFNQITENKQFLYLH